MWIIYLQKGLWDDTHSLYIIDIFYQGPLGYEGMYRKSCEITMKLMRSQKDSLLR